MSKKELHRLPVIRDVAEKRLRRRDAALQLGLTERQVQRLVNQYRTSGPEGLVHAKRGQAGTHCIDPQLRHQALGLLREHYSGFGPTLAAEKLRERHQIHLSVETLRKWMSADGLWIPHAQRKPRIYQPRHRRDCFGELIQIDGSHHDWFEGRAPKCCLLVYIDDATGRLMHLRFCETESAFDYMLATRKYVGQHGRPIAFYSDRHTVFHINHHESRTTGMTQFGRVLHDLNIELICANNPQAKGRVERANQTLQDRLVKEMRLEGISSIEEANAWMDIFITDFNHRFAQPAKFEKNLHRPTDISAAELDHIFAWQESRTLSKSLTFQYDKVIYLVDPTEENTRIAGERVMVYDYPDGTLACRYGERWLKYRIFDKLARVEQGSIVDNKRLGAALRMAQEKQEQLEAEGKMSRSKKMPRRRAQQRMQEQMRIINPELTPDLPHEETTTAIK